MIEKNDKTVIVTGGASGIGLETSKSLANAGYKVIIIDKDEELYKKFQDVDSNNFHNFTFLKLDLSEWGAANSVMQFCKELVLEPFALVNNLGYRSDRNLLTEDLESWDATFSVSLRSAFAVSQSFIAQSSFPGRRYIVNIGSVTAKFVSHQSPAYHVAKAGLEGLTRYLAVTAPAHNCKINVNCLSLGFMVQNRNLIRFQDADNAMYRATAENHLPNGEVGKDTDVANCIKFLISGDADFINGAVIPLDGGATLIEHFTSLWSNK
jgi:NAD(P)-dependent dehydrogenase (short-subunit alcohol dehydrogenase family)